MSNPDYSGELNFTCAICEKPVRLVNDTITNEDGKMVHLDCYLKQIGIQTAPNPPGQHTE